MANATIITSVRYKQSSLFLPFLRGEVGCITTRKLILRENSIIVKEKLNTFLPLVKGRLGGDVPLRDSVKRLKSAFGNKSIGAIGIISYPEFAQYLATT